MATIFHPHNSVNKKALHGGTIIYADNICIRAVSAEQLGGGGGEVIGAFLFSLGIIIFSFVGFSEKEMITSAIWLFGIAAIFIILPIIFFRYKPNYLVFSHKSQEIYYVKSPKWIVRMKWKDVVGEYKRVAIFTGSTVSQIDILRINGTSQYGKGNPVPASLPFVVVDEEHATQLWAYLQAYMTNGAESLEPPSYDRIKDGFWNEAKRLIKQIFYDAPKMVITSVFDKKLSIIFRIFILPLGLILFPFAVIMMLPMQIATAFVNSTRKRTPIPDDILPNTTDNPESWGKEPS